MPGLHLVPQRTDFTGPGAPVVRPRAILAAALLALLLASAPTPASAASVLSDASVTPTSGTTVDGLHLRRPLRLDGESRAARPVRLGAGR